MQDVFTIGSPALPKGTRVVGFRGSEGISRLYAFEIHVELAPGEGDSFELSAAVGAKGTLTLDRQDGRPPFAYHGIFSEAALVHHERDGRAFLRAVLVPRLWRLTQTLHSRIFTQQAIPDILKKTLDDGGLTSADYRLQLTGQYPPEEHVCQYRESCFDFLSRWMEREGIYYFFEQGDDGETLVLADNKSAHEALPPAPVRFFPLLGHDVSAGECLHAFVCRQRALPASVSFKDYDHTKPALDVSGSAPVSPTGLGAINVHGARFFTPEAGKRLAQLRAEEMRAREQVFTGSGTAFFLRAGYTFDLYDHPRAAFDAKYLVTEVEHFGNQSARTAEMLRLTGLAGLAEDEVYRVEVTAIPATVQFRAEQRAPWPRIYGTEHGVVDGEADSEYAQLDDHGRYLVRFAFDESGLPDGKASTRVRMMQPHGGGVEGWHFPLRKETEVLLTFLGGDPDRPVIAGVVPNAEKPSPVTKANQTRNVIQTGGRNRMEIEDKAGFERVTWTTPYADGMIRMGSPNGASQDEGQTKDHEMIIRTNGATKLDAGKDLDVSVGEDLTEDVTGIVTERYAHSQKTTIGTGREETISAGGLLHNITGDMKRFVNGNALYLVMANEDHTVLGNENHVVAAFRTITVAGGERHTVAGGVFHTVGGSVTQNLGSLSIESKGEINIKAGAPVTIYAPSWKVNTDEHEWLKGTDKDVVGFSFEATGLLIESVGEHVETVGVHVETIAAHIEHVGLAVETAAMKKEAEAIDLNTASVTLGQFAANIVCFGFCKFG
jgi:type VI secretion system secreted protein VgrG